MAGTDSAVEAAILQHPFLFILFYCNGFNLTEHALWQCLYSHTAPGRLGHKITCIHLVKGCKIIHVRKETGGLKYLIKTAARCFQDGAHVPAALFCLCFDSLRDGLVSRIHRDLPRRITRPFTSKPWEYGPIAPGAFSVLMMSMLKYLLLHLLCYRVHIQLYSL